MRKKGSRLVWQSKLYIFKQRIPSDLEINTFKNVMYGYVIIT